MTARREALLLGAASLALGLGLSAMVAPTFAELPRLAAAERVGEVVRAVARAGLPALWSPSAHAAYAAAGARGTLPMLLAAWARLSVGRVGALDLVTSARLPWLVLVALAPVWVALAVGPSRGRATALIAGALLLATPRWLHALAVAGDAAVLAGLWWLVIAAYLRCLDPGRPPRRAVAGVVLAIGVAAAVDLAALWVLPVIIVHYWIARRATARRLLRRGRLPAPAGVVIGVALLPLVVFATNPSLWGQNVIGIVHWTLAPLEADVTPTLYAGHVVTHAAVPAGYVASWLVLTLPAVGALCALVGLAVFAHAALARRFASGALRPARDPRALGTLVTLGLIATILAPALAPRPLVVLPPRVELALPFVAVAAAVGLERAARAIAGERRALVAALVLVALLLVAVRAPRTAGAAFDELLGGARRVVATRALVAGDGSELGALAPAIDALGRPRIAVAAQGVPPGMWSALEQAGRLRTTVVAGSGRDAFELVHGAARGGAVVGRVARDGVALWTLVRR